MTVGGALSFQLTSTLEMNPSVSSARTRRATTTGPGSIPDSTCIRIVGAAGPLVRVSARREFPLGAVSPGVFATATDPSEPAAAGEPGGGEANGSPGPGAADPEGPGSDAVAGDELSLLSPGCSAEMGASGLPAPEVRFGSGAGEVEGLLMFWPVSAIPPTKMRVAMAAEETSAVVV